MLLSCGMASLVSAETVGNAEFQALIEKSKLDSVELSVNSRVGEKSVVKAYIGNFGIGFNEDYTLYCESTVLDITELKASATEAFQASRLASSSAAVNSMIPGETVYALPETGEKNVYISALSRTAEAKFCRFYANKGESYSVTVSGNGGYAASVITTVSPLWYPQWMSESISGTKYWDSKNLNRAFCNYSKGGSTEIRSVFVNQSSATHCFNEACVLCSSMMIIASYPYNDYRVAAKYDIRELTSITPNYNLQLVQESLFADPYSGFLAINNMTGKDYQYDIAKNGLFYDSTISVSVNKSSLMAAFGAPSVVTTVQIDLTNGTTAVKYGLLLAAVNDVLTNNPEGIILSKSGHAIVLKKVNGNIRVFDPGRSESSDINHYYNVTLHDYFVLYKVRNISDFTSYTVFS